MMDNSKWVKFQYNYIWKLLWEHVYMYEAFAVTNVIIYVYKYCKWDLYTHMFTALR